MGMTVRCPRVEQLPDPPRGKTGWPWTEETPPAPPTMPDGLAWPRVSIITPSFNQRPFLEATIRSILLQGYPGLEYFIIDGGSTDGCLEIIRKYEPWLTYWVSEPDRGQSHAINKGFARCTGELLNWINSDDRLMPGALFAVAAEMARHPSAPAYAGIGKIVDLQGNLPFLAEPKGLRRMDLASWAENCIMQPACFFRKEALERFGGGVNEDLYLCFDVDLWMRLSQAGDFVSVGQILAEITEHPGAKSTRNRALSVVELVAVLSGNGFLREAIVEGKRLVEEYNALGWKVRRVASSLPYRILMPLIKLFFRPTYGPKVDARAKGGGHSAGM